MASPRAHHHAAASTRLLCDIEFGLSAYIVRVSLPDNSYLIISPPQEPPSERPPGDPESWMVTREHPDNRNCFEVLYDSTPCDDPNAAQRSEARHGGSAQPLTEAIGRRLDQLVLLPQPASPPAGGPGLQHLPSVPPAPAPGISPPSPPAPHPPRH
ncbi:hypothetical protein ABT278_14495 [Streptomyces sp. NPDC001228]|uniref:hypothetical protein n=1 Tax=Streptomyces sp. NPDC001228 TaxID=3154381 RepID=UPI00332A69F6